MRVSVPASLGLGLSSYLRYRMLPIPTWTKSTMLSTLSLLSTKLEVLVLMLLLLLLVPWEVDVLSTTFGGFCSHVSTRGSSGGGPSSRDIYSQMSASERRA